MAYALFLDDVKVSELVPSKADAWKFAGERGLIRKMMSLEEDPPRYALRPGYSIRQCNPDWNPESIGLMGRRQDAPSAP